MSKTLQDAYTLMSNHFHLVAVADRPDAISLFMS